MHGGTPPRPAAREVCTCHPEAAEPSGHFRPRLPLAVTFHRLRVIVFLRYHIERWGMAIADRARDKTYGYCTIDVTSAYSFHSNIVEHDAAFSEEHSMSGTTSNQRLKDWVADWAAIMQPADIYWCDGSADEYERLCQELVDSGTFTKLDEAKRPNSYWAHSDPGDVARVEDRTFICSQPRSRPARTTTGAIQRRCAPK